MILPIKGRKKGRGNKLPVYDWGKKQNGSNKVTNKGLKRQRESNYQIRTGKKAEGVKQSTTGKRAEGVKQSTTGNYWQKG